MNEKKNHSLPLIALGHFFYIQTEQRRRLNTNHHHKLTLYNTGSNPYICIKI